MNANNENGSHDDHVLIIAGIHKGRKVKISEISYFEAFDGYCKLKLTSKEEIVACRTLGSYEEELDPNIFFRCHKSFLVNGTYIKEYFKKDNEFIIVLYDQSTLLVARRRIGRFKRFLNKRSGN